MKKLGMTALTALIALGGAVLTLLLCANVANAQGIVTGTINGTVLDPQGAVVTSAKITAKELATNREYTAQTTSAGLFSVRNLPPGSYDVTIEATGFKTFESKGMTVAVGSDTGMGSVRLEIGSASQTILVEGTAPLVESTTNEISQTFDNQKVASLPIGNNFDSLTLFVPGVASSGDAGFSNNNGAEFAVNGQRSRSNNFQIDGQGNNDNSIGGPSIFFGNQDAIGEVQVVTNYSAAYGRNMGAVVNYVTKSGTNVFHGTAYEFWQGNHFDSLTNQEKSSLFSGPQGLPFCNPGQSASGGACENPVVPRYVDNRFGGSVGGPIWKNKAWFFGSTNFERTRTGGLPSSTAPRLVPTPNGIQTLLSAFPNSPAGNLYNQIGPSAVKAGNPVYSNQTLIPVTDGTTTAQVEFGSVSRFVPSPFNDYEATGRVDVKLTQKDNVFARYVFQKTETDGINFGNGISIGDWQNIPGKSQQIGLDWVRNFTDTFVNQVRFSYSRASSFFEEGGFTGCQHTNPLNCPTDVFMAGSAPQDSATFGVASGFPQGRIINVYQVQDNVSISRGHHMLRLGGEYDKQRSPSVFLPNNNGVYVFLSFNDLVANNPLFTQFTAGNPNLPFKENDLAFYFQDDWKVSSNLTLNLGLRWEWFQQAINLLHDRSVAQQTGPHPFWDTNLPLSQTTVPRVDQATHNFGPVLGFAWTPGGNSKTVLRGGFRIAYDPSFYNMFLNVATAAPAVNAAQFTAPLPQSNFLGSNLVNFLAPFVPTGGDPGFNSQTIVPKNFRNPYSEQWNLGLQYSLGQRVAAEVRYVGNHGVGNFQFLNSNPFLASLVANGFSNVIPGGLTPCSDPNAPGFGYAKCNVSRQNEYANTAYSSYNSLQTELRFADWHGVSATATYTWSHTIDNASEVFSTVAGGNTLSFAQNPFDISSAERGNSGIDFPNVFGLAVVYELPFAKGQKGFRGHVMGGWQVNTTYRYSSGQPYTVIQTVKDDLCDGSQTMSTSFDACRPILLNAAIPLTPATTAAGGIYAGRYCDGTTGTCMNAQGAALPQGTLVSFTDPCFGGACAATPINSAHWVVNDLQAAKVLGTPFAGVGRNTLRGQPLTPVNLAIYKNTKITERVNLQFQAQCFNLFNTQFLGNPDPILDDIGSGTPAHFQSVAYNQNGGLTSSANLVYDGISRRRLLFGLKLIF